MEAMTNNPFLGKPDVLRRSAKRAPRKVVLPQVPIQQLEQRQREREQDWGGAADNAPPRLARATDVVMSGRDLR
jgi:hypothetical protein